MFGDADFNLSKVHFPVRSVLVLLNTRDLTKNHYSWSYRLGLGYYNVLLIRSGTATPHDISANEFFTLQSQPSNSNPNKSIKSISILFFPT